LLDKAGLALEKEGRYSFINETSYYTVLVPSEEAILAADLQSVPVDELTQILKLHFIQGDLIFTDGKQLPGLYETMHIHESSTQYTTVFTKIKVQPGIDRIEIIDNSDALFTSVNESDNTNIIGSIVTIESEDIEEIYPNTVNNAVIHEIDKVLNPGEIGQ